MSSSTVVVALAFSSVVGGGLSFHVGRKVYEVAALVAACSELSVSFYPNIMCAEFINIAFDKRVRSEHPSPQVECPA